MMYGIKMSIWRVCKGESPRPARAAWRRAGARFTPGHALFFGQLDPIACATSPPSSSRLGSKIALPRTLASVHGVWMCSCTL